MPVCWVADVSALIQTTYRTAAVQLCQIYTLRTRNKYKSTNPLYRSCVNGCVRRGRAMLHFQWIYSMLYVCTSIVCQNDQYQDQSVVLKMCKYVTSAHHIPHPPLPSPFNTWSIQLHFLLFGCHIKKCLLEIPDEVMLIPIKQGCSPAICTYGTWHRPQCSRRGPSRRDPSSTRTERHGITSAFTRAVRTQLKYKQTGR